MVYEQQLRGNAVEFLLVTIYFPKTLQPREWFSTPGILARAVWV
jgi:hypothetical protein